MVRRTFDKQFKSSAVTLVLKEKKSVEEVSQKLNIHKNTIYRWVREYQIYGAQAFPGSGITVTEAQRKMKMMEAQRSYFQEELEFLRKSRSFLRQKE